MRRSLIQARIVCFERPSRIAACSMVYGGSHVLCFIRTPGSPFSWSVPNGVTGCETVSRGASEYQLAQKATHSANALKSRKPVAAPDDSHPRLLDLTCPFSPCTIDVGGLYS